MCAWHNRLINIYAMRQSVIVNPGVRVNVIGKDLTLILL